MQDRILTAQARSEIDKLPEPQRYQKLRELWPAIDSERELEPLREKNFEEIIRVLFDLVKDDPAIRLAIDTASIGVSSLLPSVGEAGGIDISARDNQPQHKLLVAQTPERYIFRKNGDVWQIAYGVVEDFHLKGSLGLRYIGFLLRNPNRKFSALDLLSAVRGKQQDAVAEQYASMSEEELEEENLIISNGEDAIPILDPSAMEDIKRRLRENSEERKDARERRDERKLMQLDDDYESIREELKAATGLGGRSREFSSDRGRARVSITNAISKDLKRIGEKHPILLRHLKNAIKTGSRFSYKPDTPVNWEL